MLNFFEWLSSYSPDEKYSGLIPEIRYVLVSAIERNQMDFRPEVMSVSDEVASGMDYSEPIEVTIYRYSQSHDETSPVVRLIDGHHRVAAAIQTGRSYLPVVATARNAKGVKINALIVQSELIASRL